MRWIPVATAVLALLSAATVAVGVGLAYLPAGLIVAGLEGLGAAYAAMYVFVQSSRGRS